MHLGEISFCDKIGYNIKSDEHKKTILDALQQAIHFKVIQKHFVKFDGTQCSMMNKIPHMACVRTNGNPYLLVLTQHNFVNQCIFVDKKIQQGYFYPRMILSKFGFQNTLFKNTVFDGEMVKAADGRWVFLINDLLAENGKFLEDMNLVKRVNRAYALLSTQFHPNALDCCTFQVKRYFHYHELKHMMDTFIPSLPYTCRGIYFRPLFLKFKDVLFNFNDALVVKVNRPTFKHVSNFLLKDAAASPSAPPTPTANLSTASSAQSLPALDHDGDPTKAFYIRKTNQPDVYNLYASPTDSTSQGIACVSALATSRMLRQLFAECSVQDGKWMECQWRESFGKWSPIRLRT